MRVVPVDWSRHEPGICALDVSYTTDHIYRLDRAPLSLTLVPERQDRPLRRAYEPLSTELEQLRGMPHVAVAEDDVGQILGMIAVGFEEWNRRARVDHIFIATDRRGQGIGHALMDDAIAFARQRGAWCLVAETQAANYPAARFYQSVGMRLCAIDDHFYDPSGFGGDDVAIFFALDLDPPTPATP